MKKKISYKPRKSEDWERAVEAILNGKLDVSFYPKDGELYITIGDESSWSIVIKRDGTWSLA